MNKIIILFLLLTSSSSNLFCQYDSCDKLFVPNTHYVEIDTQGVKQTSDYIKKRFPSLQNYISDRHQLNKMPILESHDKKSTFINDTLIVEITYEQIPFNPTPFFYPSDGTEPSRMIYIFKNTPYGIVEEDNQVTKIKSITINSIPVDTSSFDMLYNPNINSTYYAIKPISVFLSEQKDYIYIYVFGQLRSDVMSEQEATRFSYMGKLIYNLSGDYIGRIVLRGRELEYFNFDDCYNFIGF